MKRLGGVFVRKPHEILGVREKASRDEIVNSYNILEKKYRISRKQGVALADLDDEKFEDIEKAYCQLMGFEYHPIKKADDDYKKTYNEMDRKGKIDHFFYYYKIHVIVSILVLVFMSMTLKDCMSRKPVELEAAFVGSSQVVDSDAFAADIKKALNIKNDVVIQPLFFSEDGKSQYDIANQQKLMVLFAAGEVDVVISDYNHFEQFAKSGAYADLEGVMQELGIDASANRKAKIKVQDQNQDQSQDQNQGHYYGILLSDNKFLEKYGYAGGDNYISVAVRAPHMENANKLLKYILSGK